MSGAGALLLQGGGEMQPACRDMDGALVASAPPGRLVVLLGAAAPGADHERSADRALRYHRGLVPDRDVSVAPHPLEDLDGCLAALAGAGVVVLPGGSPSRLHEGLARDGGRLGDRLRQLHADGVAVSGSSAGAMVLCARTVLPDASPRRVVDGLALLPGLALVHDDGSDRGWSDPDDADGPRWGLPEAGGVLVKAGPDGVTAQSVGHGRPRLLLRGSSHDVPHDPTPVAELLGR